MISQKEKALDLVLNLFKDVTDKGGNPYINHLLAVANGVETEEAKTVALLHDVIEDTHITAQDLLNMGFSSDIVLAVEIITRTTETYTEFIDTIASSKNKLAITVKISDLAHNMDISRIPNPTSKDYDRISKRYKPSYEKLKKSIIN